MGRRELSRRTAEMMQPSLVCLRAISSVLVDGTAFPRAPTAVLPKSDAFSMARLREDEKYCSSSRLRTEERTNPV